ncbi:MAG: hypothetical protein COA86_08800 [Kangiella sp.]|nr:MAG: hypothetical protein COA86_08800 [Kangiella sp.]
MSIPIKSDVRRLAKNMNVELNHFALGKLMPLILLFALFFTSNTLQAQNNCDNKEAIEIDDCVVSGEWHFGLGVGIGIRTNPLNNSDNIPLVLLPKVSYYGDRFFIENLEFGYNLFDSDTSQLNLLATPSYDSVFFNRWDPSNIFVDIGASANVNTPGVGINTPEDNLTQINPEEISKRKFSYLGGLEYSYLWKQSHLQLSLLTDISDTHSGTEVRFAYQYKLNPYFSSTIGFTWKDQTLTDYYYGIDNNEIIDDRGAYQAQSSFSPFVRFSLNTSKNKDSWRVNLELQKLDSSISQSPLLKDDIVITFFIGKYFDWQD